jgi:MFS transporter, ACS family, DAL5 transporter family protein
MASLESLAGNGSLLWLVVLFSIYCLLHILKWFTQEGAFTSAFGLATLFFVPASPRNIRLLTEEEREVYCQDLADNWSGDADTDGKYDEVFSWSEVASVFTDAPHVLLTAIPLFFVGTMVTVLSVPSCR